MNRILPSAAATAIVLGLCSALVAAEKFDYNQIQSPAFPTPKWVKLVDQGERDPRLKGYVLPAGLKLEIVAEEPTTINPVGMTFADDGTPYVLEWVPSAGDDWHEKPEEFTFKDGSKHTVATMWKQKKDVVKILSSSKGDGFYDQAKQILEEQLPSSILLHDGWMYLSSRGSIRRYRQSQPGGAYDVKEVIAQGFCGFHHHQVSGMTIGNDGWLYVTSGDDDNNVEGSDGSRATVLRTGAIFRMRPDGSKVSTFAEGFRNPYRDVAFDNVGNMFHSDNDNEDGSKFTGCRIMHVAEGNDFGWRLRQGARCCQPDPVRGAVFGELPGKVPPLLKTGRGAPAGLLIYNDTRLPEEYRGLLLYPDVFRQLIRAYKVAEDGAGFKVVEEFELLKSSDPLFRPCQMVTGPDGAIYIVDWRTNSGGAGRLWGDGQHGRIYRLSWAGTPDQPALPLRARDSWAKVRAQSDEELVKTLAGSEGTDRNVARRELVKRGEKNRAALLKFFEDSKQPAPARIAALGVLESIWNEEVQKAALNQLAVGDGDIRRMVCDALGRNAAKGDAVVQAALLKSLADDNLAVRRSVAMAMSHIQASGAADNIVNALAFDDGKDVVLRDGLLRAIENLGKPGIDRLLALSESGNDKDTDKVVQAFSAFRTRECALAVPTLLANPHLRTEQKAELLRSYNNYLLNPLISLDPALAYLSEHPTEPAAVKLAGLEALSVNNALKTEKGSAWLLGLLDDNDPSLRLAVIKAVEDNHLDAAAGKLVKLLGDASRPTPERTAAAKALRTVRSDAAKPILKEILAESGSPMGAMIALRTEALRTLAAVDPAAASAAAKAYVTSSDLTLQTEAVPLVVGNPTEAKALAKLFLDKKLPPSLLPQVSEGLRKHAATDAEASALLASVMKSGLTIGNKPEEVARLTEHVRTRGKAVRGRALFLDGKTLACINCHKVEGIGGNVGPDLTRIWETQTLEKILESIVEPSKEIKEGYQTYQATTKRGQVYSGLLVSKTADEVILREASGKEQRIATGNLEELVALKTSLMPDNVVAQLSYDQFLDLLAFLKDRGQQEGLRGLVMDYHVVGPFGPDLKTAYAPEEKSELTTTYPGKKPDEKVTWQPVQAEPSGLLNLTAIFHATNASAYALTYVHSPKAQDAQMLVGSDDTVRVWINGKQVHEYATPRSAKPDEDKVPVHLEAGWNKVLVKVVNGEADHGLYLRFAGEGLRVSRTPVEEKVSGK